MNRPGQPFKDSTALILGTLLALSLLSAWMYTKGTAGLDYYVAWVAADVVKSDSKLDIYDPSSAYKFAVIYRNKADMEKDAPRQKELARHRKQLPMTATPFLYGVTGLLATGDYEKDLTRWHLLSLILLTASILVSCRLAGYSAATSFAFMLPIMVWFAPFYSDLRVGNVNSIQLGWIGLIIWLQSRQPGSGYLFAAGFFTGMLVMFKPNLAPVAILLAGGWAVRKHYPNLGISIGGIATGSLTAVLVSSAWMGSTTAWFDWFSRVMMFVERVPGKARGNHAVMAQTFKSPGAPSQLTVALLLCLLVLVAFWWGRRRASGSLNDRPGSRQELMENTCLIAAGCIIMMLASTTVWLHYYLLTIPMLILAFSPWKSAGKMGIVPILMLRVLPVIAMVLLMESALTIVIGGQVKDYWNLSTTISAVTLFIIGLWQLAYGIRVQASHLPDGEPAAH